MAKLLKKTRNRSIGQEQVTREGRVFGMPAHFLIGGVHIMGMPEIILTVAIRTITQKDG